jgi:hypothetical protein
LDFANFFVNHDRHHEHFARLKQFAKSIGAGPASGSYAPSWAEEPEKLAKFPLSSETWLSKRET